MRTVFDTEDQSMMARFENQKALNAYMDEMPFGIGMGAIYNPQIEMFARFKMKSSFHKTKRII